VDSSSEPELGEYAQWKGWATGHTFGSLQRGDAEYFARELREVRRAAPVTRVLEVGFGNAEFLRFCRDQGWEVSGTELQPELCSLAREAGFDAHPADELDRLPPGAFDLVAAFDVFEHIDPGSSINFLTSLRARLSDGGRILMRFPNADSWLGNAFQNGDPTHVNAVGYLKLSYYAQAAGLHISVFRGATRRGFRTSWVHGLHAVTAGAWISLMGRIRRAMYFPALPVVLSTSDVICMLTKPAAAPR